MTEHLFQKAFWLTDLHFGRSGGSPVANADNLEFLDWAIDRALSWGADTVIFGGDWYDQRHSIQVATLHASRTGMHKLSRAFKRIFWLPGNHDLLYRERRDVTSIGFARDIPNVTVIDDPITLGGVSLLPWLVGQEAAAVPHMRSRYVFGHLEMSGFQMNAHVVLPDAPHLLNAAAFTHQEYVFSGHFHRRQQAGRVLYTGNVFPFDFSDAGDAARGIMLLDWGGEPRFEPWPQQPLYRTATLSAVLADPGAYLCPKLTLRAVADLPLRFEELTDLRDTLARDHGVRRFELAHAPPPDAALDPTVAQGAFKTVDQSVIEGIGAIESTGIDSTRLVEIYQSLIEA